jgi:hypothetical protein
VVAVECQAEWVVWVVWVVWAEWECNTVPQPEHTKKKIKQLDNPQKEISEGFFMRVIYFLRIILIKNKINNKYFNKKKF